MRDRIEKLIRSFIPDTGREVFGLVMVSTLLSYVVYSIFLQPPPSVIIYNEEPYIPEVAQGGYLTWKVDVSYNRSCNVLAKRIITGSDGVEYLAVEDSKDVIANERVQYEVRVPVSSAMPLGPAHIRSKVEYRCDFWTTYIKPITTMGRDRGFIILPPEDPVKPAAMNCILPHRPGYIVVRAYYRILPGSK